MEWIKREYNTKDQKGECQMIDIDHLKYLANEIHAKDIFIEND